jgi:hypothetical protein
MRALSRLRIAVKVVSGVAIVAAAMVGLGVALGAMLSVIVARRVVTPPGRRDSVLRILAVGESTIVLSSTEESRAPGRFSLWFADETGFARIGQVVSQGQLWVARELLDIEKGIPQRGDNARTSG